MADFGVVSVSSSTGGESTCFWHLTPERRQRFDIGEDQQGVLVVDVAPDSAAARQGIRPGDIITRVGSKTVRTPQDVVQALEQAREAGRESVLFLRQRNENQSFVAVPFKPDKG